MPEVGDIVRLVRPASGMAAGSEGILRGWYAQEVRLALVSFWDGGPTKVPADSIEKAFTTQPPVEGN